MKKSESLPPYVDLVFLLLFCFFLRPSGGSASSESHRLQTERAVQTALELEVHALPGGAVEFNGKKYQASDGAAIEALKRFAKKDVKVVFQKASPAGDLFTVLDLLEKAGFGTPTVNLASDSNAERIHP